MLTALKKLGLTCLKHFVVGAYALAFILAYVLSTHAADYDVETIEKKESSRVKLLENWDFVAGLYAELPWVSGFVQAGPVGSSVSFTAHDALDTIRFAFFADLEATYKKKYSFSIDGAYGDFGKSVQLNAINRVGFTFQQTVIEVRGGYRLWHEEDSFIEVFVGGRYWDVDANLQLFRPERPDPFSGSSGSFWVDPFWGFQTNFQIYGPLRFRGLADIGGFSGFGLGSDFTYRVQAGLQYEFESGFGLEGSFKALYANYDNGKPGLQRFVWDTTTSLAIGRAYYKF